MKLTDPIFHNADLARAWFEAERWPNGPVCPHCGNSDQTKIAALGTQAPKADSKGTHGRAGLYKCYAINEDKPCRKQFSVTINTVMERTHYPLNLWALAMFLMANAKKSVSARQMKRMMDAPSMKTIWFLCHRIREAMKDDNAGPLGGHNKVIESDESVFGGKSKNRAYKPEPKKQIVMTLVERDGKSRSFHITNVTAKTLRETMVKVADRKSHLMTDELASYTKVGKEFAGHSRVNHSANEYAKLGGFAHVNTAECRFSLMKRAVFGAHHSVSEAHLHRYLVEWDFKWNTRKMPDGDRTALIARQAEGKRLTYQRPA
jgi:transposase-like protein